MHKFNILIITLFLLCQKINSNAQSSSFVFIHGIGGIPTDQSTKNQFSSSFGLDAGFGIGSNTSYFVTGLGFLSCSAKDSFKTETYIPLKVGLRQYFTTQKKIYFAGNVGAGFVANSNPTKQTPNPSSTRIAFDAGLGIDIKGFDAMLAYDVFKEPKPDGYSGFIEVKIGWKFFLKK